MSDLVKVRIKGLVMTSQYGTLSDGDELSCSADFAKHLVEDCKAAEYVAAEKSTSSPAAQQKKATTKAASEKS